MRNKQAGKENFYSLNDSRASNQNDNQTIDVSLLYLPL